jgi:hypothetical protein
MNSRPPAGEEGVPLKEVRAFSMRREKKDPLERASRGRDSTSDNAGSETLWAFEVNTCLVRTLGLRIWRLSLSAFIALSHACFSGISSP